MEASSRVPRGDILLVVGNFADERAVAPILLTRDFRFAAFVGAGVEEVLAELGSLREGLLGPAQWVSTAKYKPDEGPDTNWFIHAYRESVGADPPYPAAQAFAAGLLCARCLREWGSCDDRLNWRQPVGWTAPRSTEGFELNPKSGLQSGHRICVVQWQQDQRCVVWPPEQAERPLQMLGKV